MSDRINHTKLAYMRVKIKSLAAEAKIIRAAEIKSKMMGDSPTLTGLHLHRVNDVRGEARSAQLAKVLICGRRYVEAEGWSRSTPNWSRIAVIASKYGSRTYTSDDVWKWGTADEQSHPGDSSQATAVAVAT